MNNHHNADAILGFGAAVPQFAMVARCACSLAHWARERFATPSATPLIAPLARGSFAPDRIKAAGGRHVRSSIRNGRLPQGVKLPSSLASLVADGATGAAPRLARRLPIPHRMQDCSSIRNGRALRVLPCSLGSLRPSSATGGGLRSPRASQMHKSCIRALRNEVCQCLEHA